MRIKIIQKLIDKLRNKKTIKVPQTIIKQHPKRASNGESMKQFVDWVKTHSVVKPEVIFEIGANYAQDAEGLRHYFNLPEENIWVFEAHPDICKEISKMYNFNVFNNAVFNEEKEMEFNAVDINDKNSGVSSLYNSTRKDREFKRVKVGSIRMDNFMQKHNIKEVDFLKLDVEGCNWEVLDGFGERLKDVKIIHIEAEHVIVWENQKLFEDIKSILEKNGFTMIFFQRYSTQSDSMWIQKDLIKMPNIERTIS